MKVSLKDLVFVFGLGVSYPKVVYRIQLESGRGKDNGLQWYKWSLVLNLVRTEEIQNSLPSYQIF